MHIKDIMSSPAETIKEDFTILEAAKIMQKHNIGCLIVQDIKDSSIVGIITERDILFKVTAQNKMPSDQKVKDIMITNVISATPDMDIYEASKLLEEKQFRRLPVCRFIPAIHKNKLVGIVTETDIHLALRDHTINELKTKLHELELFSKMAIGRELKMTELKKKIEKLEGKK